MFLHPLQSKIIMYQGNKKMAQSPFFKAIQKHDSRQQDHFAHGGRGVADSRLHFISSDSRIHFWCHCTMG